MKNYKMSKLIRRYYSLWLNGPTLMEHIQDRERFFRFIKSCIRYSRRDIHGSWLKYFLERDLSSKYTTEYREKVISEIVILFENILDFIKTDFPDHVLEMRNPSAVYLQLHSYGYSDKEIEEVLRKNFGISWREKYMLK